MLLSLKQSVFVYLEEFEALMCMKQFYYRSPLKKILISRCIVKYKLIKNLSCCRIESSYYQLSFSEMTNFDISISSPISTDFGSSVLYLKENVQLKINIESTFLNRRTIGAQ